VVFTSQLTLTKAISVSEITIMKAAVHQLQAGMHFESLDTGTVSLNRFDGHYCPDRAVY